MANLSHLLMPPGSYLVVLDDENRGVGLITHQDFLNNPGGKVKECNFIKPSITADLKIDEVLDLMTVSYSDTLPVVKDGDIIGVINQRELTLYLIKELKRYKVIIQSVVSDLRGPINNLIGINSLLKENIQKSENIELLELTKQVCDNAMDILDELSV